MNAVFVDGAGNRREMNVPDFRPEYLITLPNPPAFGGFRPHSPQPIHSPMAVFRLSAVQNGRAIYQFSHVDHD
jgi:hypothetical protein